VEKIVFFFIKFLLSGGKEAFRILRYFCKSSVALVKSSDSSSTSANRKGASASLGSTAGFFLTFLENKTIMSKKFLVKKIKNYLS
jgi:hypothetical protein